MKKLIILLFFFCELPLTKIYSQDKNNELLITLKAKNQNKQIVNELKIRRLKVKKDHPSFFHMLLC